MARLLSSLSFAIDILKGSIRLLGKYPVLVIPLLPVLFMVIGLEFAIVFVIQDWLSALVLIFVVAFELMFSFVVTGNMILQIHKEKKPSLGEAITSASTVRIIPKVFLLSIVWFTLILIIIAIEMAINSILNRSSNGGRAGGLINSIFGAVADALRMMGFMMIPIMIFEQLGLIQGFKRLKATLTDNPITALSGLALTKVATTLIFLAITGISQVVESLNIISSLVVVAVMGMGWILSMYLEQIFVTGLYLYSAFPESKVVGILLEKHLGRELPRVPVPEVSDLPVSF